MNYDSGKDNRLIKNPVSLGGFVPTLQDICLNKIKENIDSIKNIGLINNELLIRVFEKCTPSQLGALERKLSHREIDTGFIWRRFCVVEFNVETLEHGVGSWKAYYNKLQNDYQERTTRSIRALRSQYNEKENEKKSKQIKVISMPDNRPRASGGGGGGRSYSSSSYSVGRSSSSSPKASTSRQAPAASTTGKLMAKVLKEHRRSKN
ncbi:hypothetical protein SAMD00019534_075350 [Acytostelium subglobosum LB1]|uniref:hypothetical protein n=1 Tax=Acytostelium subglobosum LB1 TaxID=1410327 RepID=UPI000644F799|nr:hypothetical protein SAMD00019534_075350 [Acytostelium subglobosum LB1]GAM24360.1 hypothetical protein SAMD00019534_075350 [Acytostelium subglobosum LB1]|eukprot:XP_012752686.1 hypothetical protein SAMD00019534_075350 [Acytostelium subglobosum LB1]